MSIELIKLKALKNNLSSLLKGRTPQEQLRPTAFYDPLDVENLFIRFGTIRDTLIQTHPVYFHDFPIRDVRPTKSRDFGGRGCYERNQLDILLNDINASKEFYRKLTGLNKESIDEQTEKLRGLLADYFECETDIIAFNKCLHESWEFNLIFLENRIKTDNQIFINNPGFVSFCFIVKSFIEMQGDYRDYYAAGPINLSKISNGKQVGFQVMFFRDPDNYLIEFIKFQL